ncbi:glutaminyl-peptide cyclotransferase [Flavobacteriaceae bacterium LMO-SS05]
MKISITVLTAVFYMVCFVSCGNSNNSKSHKFSIETNAKKNTILLGETLELTLKNPKNLKINSVVYQIDDKTIENSSSTQNLKLGSHLLTATVHYDNMSESVSTKLFVLNNKPPKIYTYNIINQYPHDITSYTQGLEFHNGELYESTGQYGESKLRKVDYKTGSVLKNIDLTKAYFGEGMTILNDKIYQLTWQENTGFVYDLATFEKTESFKYGESKEGWGLCNDGKVLYKSDGTENIWVLNPETKAEESHIQAYHNRGKVVGLNELEWVNGKIYANRYQLNGVAIINPENGAVEGVIDFSPLRKLVTQHQGLDVLNGIAYNPDTQTLFVTGKRWDKLFEVQIIEK